MAAHLTLSRQMVLERLYKQRLEGVSLGDDLQQLWRPNSEWARIRSGGIPGLLLPDWAHQRASIISWDDWNYRYLLRSFSSQEAALSYGQERPRALSGEASSETERQEILTWLTDRVLRIRQLEEELDLYNDPPPEAHVRQTINIQSGAHVVQLAAKIENLNSMIGEVATAGQPQLAEALAMLGQAVIDEPTMDDQRKGELTENLGDLGEQAELPTGQRKQGRIRAALDAIAGAAAAGTQLHEAWTAWGPTIQQLLPR